jgi:hypothetical protein
MPVYKKGNRINCSNYSAISLSPTTYKILSNILLSSFTPYAEKLLGIISVDFDATGQLPIIHSAFPKYLEKMGIHCGNATAIFRLQERLRFI